LTEAVPVHHDVVNRNAGRSGVFDQCDPRGRRGVRQRGGVRWAQRSSAALASTSRMTGGCARRPSWLPWAKRSA